MQNLKDKMYNYEVTPPKQSWDIITSTLDEEKTEEQFPAKKIYKTFYYGLSAAATVAIIVFSLIFWVDYSNKKSNETTVVQSTNLNDDTNNNSDLLNTDDKITIPKSNPEDEMLTNNTTSVKEKNKLKGLAVGSHIKKYITITGPQGKPVKISSKAATLIVSSDDQNPPKPVWSAKVNKWKDIMKANTLAPTTANFLDIVGLTQALKEQNTP
jgi:hypothetical protein